MPSKRAWTRGEKWLFAAPLLFVFLGIGAWLWRRAMPISVRASETTDIVNLRFSPDGKQLAIIFRNESGPPVPAQIYDVETHNQICELENPPSSISGVSWSPDGKRLVASFDNGIALWDAQSGQLTGNYPCAAAGEDSSCYPMGFSTDGTELINYGYPLSFYDANTGERRRILARNRTVNFNPELGLWAQVDEKISRIQVFDAKTRRKIWESKPMQQQEFYAPGGWAWHGNMLWTPMNPLYRRDNYGLGLLWDGKTRAPISAPPADRVLSLSINVDGKTLAFVNSKSIPPTPTTQAVDQCDIVVWDYRANRELWRQPVEWAQYNVEWSPDGKWLSSVFESPQDSKHWLHVYDRSGHLHLKRQVVGSYMYKWSPDSRQIAIAETSRNPNRQIQLVRVGE